MGKWTARRMERYYWLGKEGKKDAENFVGMKRGKKKMNKKTVKEKRKK